MARKELTLDDILTYIDSLPYDDFRKVVEHYSNNTVTDFKNDTDRLTTFDFEKRLQKLGINSTCPKCVSKKIKKNCRRSYLQLYKCNDCGTKFTHFTGTILEKTRWHWDIWIKVFEMTLNSYSIDDMLQVLEKDYGCDGINRKTVWLWRIKLIHALASLPAPKLAVLFR